MVYKVLRNIRIKLDDVIKDKKTEQLIMENLRRCRYFAGKEFGLVLWNENLSEDEVKKFFNRHFDLLSLLNTKITKTFETVWFLINTDNENGDKSKYRWKYDGSILEGIVMFNKLINHMNHVKNTDRSKNKKGNK